jgi:hypothetical protein
MARDREQKGSTMPYFGYMLYQAERPKAAAEQRQADAQLGQFFAALPRRRRSLPRPERGPRRDPGRAARTADQCST